MSSLFATVRRWGSFAILLSKMQICETLLKGYEYGRGTYKTPCPKDMIMSIMSMENKTKLLIVLLLGASGMREIKIMPVRCLSTCDQVIYRMKHMTTEIE